MLKPSPPIGATLIVAGTTIGAGMLALPIISHGLGFGLMALLMLLTWGLMAIAALFTLEANLAIKPGCSLFVMATETLGGAGRLIAVSAMLFLFYALLAAYIAGGGAQLSQYISFIAPDSIPENQLGIVLFALIFGTMAAAGIRYVDICNRLLFLFMLLAFLVALVFLSPGTSFQKLQSLPNSPWQGFVILPVIFTSFGYHGSIPSLIAYVGPRKKLLRKIFLLGSFLPLLIYLIWLAIALGQLNDSTLASISENGSVSELVQALSHNKSSCLTTALHIFTDLALITSFLGVALGLFDFVHSATASSSRLKTAFLVYLPPLAIALLIPDAFVIALSYAALALAVLAILLPTMILSKLRQNRTLTRLPGGWLFWPTLAFGVVVSCLSLLFS
ncbi:aromatic amino acid transport family protein [Parendozoicomonas sp. Alg238-R29]|uniref:aromatic amino acid transport family protein n=1 Tax=Parendozoicomonas sp. Alg238-R29 TaxID=2993446 RepID=UPI00248F1B7C|nr:aromatic amino acid transport family protein [Parendozoicomonas sp. Alg238-R29]